MTIIDFDKIADDTLKNIFESLEKLDESGEIECDLIDDILTIEDDEEQQFIINKHQASGQIWYSSPISGGVHFSYDSNSKKWKTSKGQELYIMLKEEIKGF